MRSIPTAGYFASKESDRHLKEGVTESRNGGARKVTRGRRSWCDCGQGSWGRSDPWIQNPSRERKTNRDHTLQRWGVRTETSAKGWDPGRATYPIHLTWTKGGNHDYIRCPCSTQVENLTSTVPSLSSQKLECSRPTWWGKLQPGNSWGSPPSTGQVTWFGWLSSASSACGAHSRASTLDTCTTFLSRTFLFPKIPWDR